MTEPVAHMLPSDLARFATSETTGTAFSVAVGTPDERSVPLYTVPIDMVLHCPNCGAQHIDAVTETWPNDPHRTHLCHYCEHRWRPADVATNGVEAVKTRGKDDSPIVDRSRP
jgi:hypothetical protein